MNTDEMLQAPGTERRDRRKKEMATGFLVESGMAEPGARRRWYVRARRAVYGGALGLAGGSPGGHVVHVDVSGVRRLWVDAVRAEGMPLERISHAGQRLADVEWHAELSRAAVVPVLRIRARVIMRVRIILIVRKRLRTRVGHGGRDR